MDDDDYFYFSNLEDSFLPVNCKQSVFIEFNYGCLAYMLTTHPRY